MLSTISELSALGKPPRILHAPPKDVFSAKVCRPIGGTGAKPQRFSPTVHEEKERSRNNHSPYTSSVIANLNIDDMKK